MKNYRHGDMSLIGIDKIPNDAKKNNTKTIMQGSGGNNHSFDNGTFYISGSNDIFVIGYLKAKNTKLFHIDHGKEIQGKALREAVISDGCYEIRRQFEDTNEGMEPVID